MSIVFRLELPRRLYQEMVLQAQEELPNECCGLLAGTLDAGVGQVTARYPLINEAASPREYLSEGRGMLNADKDMRRQKLELLAIYHSHPTSRPIPSKTDLARNYSTDVMNLIISLVGDEPELRGWWLTAEEYREAEWTVVES